MSVRVFPSARLSATPSLIACQAHPIAGIGLVFSCLLFLFLMDFKNQSGPLLENWPFSERRITFVRESVGPSVRPSVTPSHFRAVYIDVLLSTAWPVNWNWENGYLALVWSIKPLFNCGTLTTRKSCFSEKNCWALEPLTSINCLSINRHEGFSIRQDEHDRNIQQTH